MGKYMRAIGCAVVVMVSAGAVAQLADATRREVARGVGQAANDCADLGSGALTAAQTAAGCETLGTAVVNSGIYEYQSVVTTAIGVFVAIAVFWGGWYLARRIIMGATRST